MTRNARKWVLLLALFALAVSPEGLAQTGVGAPGGRIPVGIWMDIGSIPHDSGGIRKIVDDLADMGILDVYAQVFNRGLTIYPSAVAAGYGLPAQRGTFAGLDPLKDLIEHAHLRGLRVHAWLDVLYVGYKERGALLDRYPSWETVARDGSRGHGPPGNQQLTSLSPRVDGDLSDDAWLDAAPLSLSHDVMKPRHTWPGENPQVRIVHDAHGIYMALSTALTGTLRRQPVATRDGPVFYDDSLEIFLDPTSSESLFYHFAFNLPGTRYDATRLSGPSWNQNWDVACREENGIWQSEVFIPFEAFGRRPDHREEWRFNVCMNAPDSGRFMSWAPLPGIYAAPRCFGKIRFEAGR